jgi:hypothetical protein
MEGQLELKVAKKMRRVSSKSPSGAKAPSSNVNCSLLSKIRLASMLDEWKCLIDDAQQLLPSPRLCSSEHQKLWKEELE